MIRAKIISFLESVKIRILVYVSRGFIIYRNEDMEIGGRRFRHIDVEMTYGE